MFRVEEVVWLLAIHVLYMHLFLTLQQLDLCLCCFSFEPQLGYLFVSTKKLDAEYIRQIGNVMGSPLTTCSV